MSVRVWVFGCLGASKRLMDPHPAHLAETLKEYFEGLCVSECLCVSE